jgi:hypothetical protein
VLLVENNAERKIISDCEPVMKQLANENGGTFKWVEMDSPDP